MPTSQQMRIIRSYVTSAYDLQKLRIQVGGRIYANFRAKLKSQISDDELEIEIEEAQVMGELSKDAEKLIIELKREYTLLTDGIAKNRTLPDRRGFVGDKLITEFTELVLIHQYFQIETQEKKQFALIIQLLEDIPIYENWLKSQKGIGPAFAGVFLGYFDVFKANYVSSFWAYCGMDVAPDGFARSKRKEHLIKRTYTKRDGTEGTKMSTTYNPWLQAKLIGAVGPSLMRANSPYRKNYDNYKQRITTDPARIKCTTEQYKKAIKEAQTDEEYDEIRRTMWPPKRIHKASIRYMLKILIKDFWITWRHLEGLPTPLDYNEARRGYSHDNIAGLGDQPQV